MSTKAQFSLLFIFGLVLGILVESKFLGPIAKGARTTSAVGNRDVEPNLDASLDDQAQPLQPTIAGIPQLSVDARIFDFGDRDSGEVVEHTFVLNNTGNGTLLISDVKNSCGCTSSQLTSNSIPPGGKAELTLKLNLYRQKGRQNRAALVQSNDPSTPNLKLALVGNAVYHVALMPRLVNFGEIANAESKSQVFVVEADETVEAFNIVRTRTSDENVKAEVKIVEPGKKFHVNVIVTPRADIADLQGWVHLVTDHPGEYGLIGIPVLAKFSPSSDSDEEVSIRSSQDTNNYTLDAEIGEALEIKGITLGGDPIDLVDYAGKPTLVVFWASTCGACQNEFAALKNLYREYHEQGLEVVGINVDSSAEERQEYMEQAELPWPNLIAKGEETGLSIARKYQVRAIPSMVLLDREGKIIAIDKRGELLRAIVSETIESQEGT